MKPNPTLENWGKRREYGVMHFIILRGFLGFALPGSLLYSYLAARHFGVDFMQIFPRAMSLFLLASLLFCGLIWKLMEKRYQEYVQKSGGFSTPEKG